MVNNHEKKNLFETRFDHRWFVVAFFCLFFFFDIDWRRQRWAAAESHLFVGRRRRRRLWRPAADSQRCRRVDGQTHHQINDGYFSLSLSFSSLVSFPFSNCKRCDSFGKKTESFVGSWLPFSFHSIVEKCFEWSYSALANWWSFLFFNTFFLLCFRELVRISHRFRWPDFNQW